ncbi:MAG: helicase 2 family protein, partial [Chlamydiia bacterium]|nr:helicase 2 family protein [Chlamydiia bacterium]
MTQTQIVNFRKIKQDFASQALREGKELYAKGVVKQAKIIQFGAKVIKVAVTVTGMYQNDYHCEMEIDRLESEVIDSSCDCPHSGDCQHLACVIFHLEEELEKMIFGFSQEKKKKNEVTSDKVVHEIEKKIEVRQKKEMEKQQLDEYVTAATVLGRSAFFVPEEELSKDQGELSFVLVPTSQLPLKQVELQLVLRLPFRSKPFYIQHPKQFFASVQAQEPVVFGGRRLSFGVDSFGPFCEELIKALRPHLHYSDVKTEKGVVKVCELDREGLGEILAVAREYADDHVEVKKSNDKGSFSLPGLFWESQEQPLFFSEIRAEFSFRIEYLTNSIPQFMLVPSLYLGTKRDIELRGATIFECSRPGAIVDGLYFRFASVIKRQHIHELESIQQMAIPEPLFGCFIENALPELHRFAKVANTGAIDSIVTCPSPGDLKATCNLSYGNGELEATIKYRYGKITMPDAVPELTQSDINSFVTPQGILARNLVEENALVRDLFQGFIKDEKTGAYVAKNDKKIVEFMTEVIPQNQQRVQFSCPENLQSQFSYDDTRFTISLSEGKSIDRIKLDFKVEGDLKGCSVDYLWDSVGARRTYIVMAKKGAGKFVKDDGENELSKAQKILVLKLDVLAPTLQIFDELQIKKLDDTTIELPLWTLVNLQPNRFEGSLISLKLTNRLKEIQEQIFDMTKCKAPPLPKSVKAVFRPYQVDGIEWLARLRQMGLNGILADDMGLGKTLQAITAVTQYHESLKGSDSPALSLIVCPTSLVDNWKEEFHTFHPNLLVATFSGVPQERN